MGKHIHRLSEKDFETLTAVCANCGPTTIKVLGNSYQCQIAYNALRRKIHKDRTGQELMPKDDHCARCNFYGEPCQLDRDHINGDRTDHRPENIQTLCANCHRLKSYHPELL